jgi:hypothetical protein
MQQFPLLPLDKTMNLMKSIPGIIVRFQPNKHLKTFFFGSQPLGMVIP